MAWRLRVGTNDYQAAAQGTIPLWLCLSMSLPSSRAPPSQRSRTRGLLCPLLDDQRMAEGWFFWSLNSFWDNTLLSLAVKAVVLSGVLLLMPEAHAGQVAANQQQLQATKSPNRSATSPWTVVPRAQELTCSCSLVLPGIGSKASLLLHDEEGLLASKTEGGPAQCACRGVSQRLRQHEVAALLRRLYGELC